MHPCRSHFQRIRKNRGQYSHSTILRRDLGLEEQKTRPKISHLQEYFPIRQHKLLDVEEES